MYGFYKEQESKPQPGIEENYPANYKNDCSHYRLSSEGICLSCRLKINEISIKANYNQDHNTATYIHTRK